MKLFLTSLLSLFLVVSFAKKDTIITYYGYNGNEIKKKDHCTYYRKTFKKSDNTFGFIQYYKSGELHKTGSFESDGLTKTGQFVYYTIEGIKFKEENYVSDLKEGEFKEWYDDGTPLCEGFYVNDKRSGAWKWWFADGSSSGQGSYLSGEKEGEWKSWYRGERLNSIGNYKFGKKEGDWKFWFRNGSIDQEGVYIEDKREGDWLFYFESGMVASKEEYENGEAIKVEFWDESGNSVKPEYETLEKDPEFPGGEMAMVKFIQKNVLYPELSREMGDQGTVYVFFVVAKDGKLAEFDILKSVSKLLDEEAMRVIQKMPDWIPGYSHNRIIDIEYVIPIKFSIA